MRVMIVDDEPRAREILRHLLARDPDLTVVAEAATGLDAVKLAREHQPDAAFMDIRMPDLDGVEAARLILSSSPRTRVVFVTAYEEYAVPAFDLEAADYLVKPLTTARVVQAVERVRRRLDAAPSQMATGVSTPGSRGLGRLALETSTGATRRTVFVDTGEILVLEAAGKHTAVRTAEATYTVTEGLSELAARLPSTQFLRVHRGFVLNLSSVRELFTDGRTYAVRIEGLKDPVPVSRERVGQLKESLARPADSE